MSQIRFWSHPCLQVGLPKEDEGILAAGRDGGSVPRREGHGGDRLLVAEEVEDGASLEQVEYLDAAVEGR